MNVVRHSQASSVRVRLVAEADTLELSVRDNGAGMPEEVLNDPKSIGLIQMRERAKTHGGVLLIEAAPSGGTIIRVRVPLKEVNNSA